LRSQQVSNMKILSLLLVGGTILVQNTSATKGLGQLKSRPEREIPFLLVPDLIRYWGYSVEEYWVTTEDGYIEGIHRIPYGVSGPGDNPRPAVLLMHGLMSSSSQWVFGPPEKSLGFILADAGYDVWMGNTRGNTYSRNHTYLDPDKDSDKPEFWDFDWHEGGMYDVPAAIDHVISITGQKKIFYVGHSMGCTEYLVTLTLRPEYNEKIISSFLLAPAAYMDNAYDPILAISAWADDIEIIYNLFGFYEFLPHMEILTWLGHHFCSDAHPIYQELCTNAAFLFFGFNPDLLNSTMIPVYLDHIPEGTSTRSHVHYAQEYLSGKFEAYDFGPEGNEAHYGSSTAPDYDLTKVTVPTALMKADLDDLADIVDVDRLCQELPNCILNHLVEFEGFGHLDFAIGMNADALVYSYILDLFAQYNNNNFDPTITLIG